MMARISAGNWLQLLGALLVSMYLGVPAYAQAQTENPRPRNLLQHSHRYPRLRSCWLREPDRPHRPAATALPERVVDAAREAELDTLVLHIDTDGGKVSNARETFKKVVEQKRDGPRMIAFVDFRAISAGAMVSYAHEQIFISPNASIGDIGVIFVSREGEIKYAPEKIETVGAAC